MQFFYYNTIQQASSYHIRLRNLYFGSLLASSFTCYSMPATRSNCYGYLRFIRFIRLCCYWVFQWIYMPMGQCTNLQISNTTYLKVPVSRTASISCFIYFLQSIEHSRTGTFKVWQKAYSFSKISHHGSISTVIDHRELKRTPLLGFCSNHHHKNFLKLTMYKIHHILIIIHSVREVYVVCHHRSLAKLHLRQC